MGSPGGDSTPTNAPVILGVAGFMTALSLTVVSLRIWIRHWMLHALGIDDWFIVLAMLTGIGAMICFVGETHNGAGRHFDAIQVPEEYERLRKWQWSQVVTLITGISFVKLSVSFFLRRFVQGKRYTRFIKFMIGFIVLFTIGSEGPLVLECIPISQIWLWQRPANANCISRHTFNTIGVFNGSLNIITDFVFVVLPIPIVLGLNVSRRTKATLVAILSLGLFACITGIVRAVKGSRFLVGDFTWSYDYFLWNAAELHSGILAASLPSLRPLYRKMLDNTSKRYRTGEHFNTQYAIQSAGLRASKNGYLKQDDISLKNLEPWPKGNDFGETAVSAASNLEGSRRYNGGEFVRPNVITKHVEVCVQEGWH